MRFSTYVSHHQLTTQGVGAAIPLEVYRVIVRVIGR
jgi:type III secretion system FlhB-like substrate exporter